MNIKRIILTVIPIIMAFSVSARDIDKATIAVTKVEATKALTTAMDKASSRLSLQRVLESIDSNLTAAIQETRKFEVLSRSDTDALLKEQDFTNSGNVNAADKNAAKSGLIKSAKYILVVSVDDFQDYIEKNRFAMLGKNVEGRKIRFGVVAKVMDSTTGAILETVNIISAKNMAVDNDSSTKISGGSKTDSLIAQLARDMCGQIARRVVDVIFPARIVAITGKMATFNRGDGTGVNVGDEYEVYAAGKEMIDPDTGESLGKEEIRVGKLRVMSITPKFSNGEILEDKGVDVGQILRPSKKVVSKADKDAPEV